MNSVVFHLLTPSDTNYFPLIADWYYEEWKVPKEKTISRLQDITKDKTHFHVLMLKNNVPLCTGGINNQISLLEKEPRFKIHPNWLASLYTIPNERGKGYAYMLCKFIENHAKTKGIGSLYLFTSTAETLYNNLGWEIDERLTIETRKIVVMKKLI